MASRVMEKTIQLQQQQQPPPPPPPPHEALKCPRCDSSNTKFCYYNNYSLSQPRHFCKACKRYWTRGGTLRNVPVGGGCRKNKRVKRPPITNTTSNAPATQSQVDHHHHHTNPNPNNNNNNQINQIPSSSTTTSNTNSNHHHHLNPLFYGLIAPHQNPPNYPRFDTTTSTRVSSVNENNHLVSGGYSTLIQPQHMNNINASESLNYSPLGAMANHDQGSNLNFNSYNNNSFMYGGGGLITSSSSSAPSTMASLLASTLNQQRVLMGGFANYEHGSSNNLVIKDLKLENNSQNKIISIMDWNNNNFHGGQNKSDHNYDKIDEAVVVSSSDPNSILWDAAEGGGGGGGWLIDQTNHNNNIGSTSVPSLI